MCVFLQYFAVSISIFIVIHSIVANLFLLKILYDSKITFILTHTVFLVDVVDVIVVKQ